jgi:hypothetical protein
MYPDGESRVHGQSIIGYEVCIKSIIRDHLLRLERDHRAVELDQGVGPSCGGVPAHRFDSSNYPPGNQSPGRAGSANTVISCAVRTTLSWAIHSLVVANSVQDHHRSAHLDQPDEAIELF